MTESEKVVINKDQTLKELYRKLPDIKGYLASLGCPSTDAEDVFQEALLIFSRKLDEPNFELTVEPFHYVKNTAKFVWYNTSRKNAKMRTEEISDTPDFEDHAWMEKELKLRRIEVAITKIGQKCQQLLKMFYGGGASMSEIAKKLGMRNDKVAKAQKYRCIHKVNEVLDNTDADSEDYSLLKS
ncbi:MAG: sigma-70 family RNA polymerase sigma factor [bacterium]|nr:sigma-70 family RNA polymerase sigma factor [bacterium]